MATKARDIIKAALKEAGILAIGESPGAEQTNDGISSLNRMLDRWSVESLLIPHTQIEQFDSLPGQASYTIGPGGDLDTERPVQILNLGLVVDGVEYELFSINRDQWASESLKNTASTIPTKYYAEGAFPLEKIHLWPVPSGSVTLKLYSNKVLQKFENANSEVELPPGYEDAIILNLAVRIGRTYGVPLDPTLIGESVSAVAAIKRKNIKPIYLGVDPALCINRPFDILKGE